MGITFASSVFSPGLSQVAEEFDIGQEVSTLGLSLLLFGFGLGYVPATESTVLLELTVTQTAIMGTAV